MASISMHCGGKTKILALQSPLVQFNHISKSNNFVSVPKLSHTRLSNSPSIASGLSKFNESVMIRENEALFSENLDGWITKSVVEIVKSLRKAPLLVHVYCNESMEVKTEEGVEENWGNLEREWRIGERKCPDGIIFVEELEHENKGGGFELGIGEEDKIWGVLVQGKKECKSKTACYLLKTCRVNSGVGFFGTHFSLVKVQSFEETVFSQIRNSWLLQ